MKKLVLHSGGMDSVACMLDSIEKYGAENIISMGFNYGQRHFEKENEAAERFNARYGIRKRVILNVPIKEQIGGSPLVDENQEMPTDMSNQRITVVPQRNAIFLFFAAAWAEVNGCDMIVHGAVEEDYEAYRDCRTDFFQLMEMAIQAGRTKPVKGSEDVSKDLCMLVSPLQTRQIIPDEKLDLTIATPLVFEKKEDTVKRIVAKYGREPYKYSYTCYMGTTPQCGKCPACIERKHAFKVNGLEDPVE